MAAIFSSSPSSRSWRLLARIFVLFLPITTAAPSLAMICAMDHVPAATLLVPYFEVDVGGCEDQFGPLRTTEITIFNVGATPRVVGFTLWTDQGVQASIYWLYLAGFDSQEIDLAELLCDGVFPATGAAASPHGAFSEVPVEYTLCNNTATPGAGPNYPNPALSASARAHLSAWLTGKESPSTDTCAGFDHGDSMARGYITVDVVDTCFGNPSLSLYHSGAIAHDNVLAGSYRIEDRGDNAASGFPAVAIEAVPDGGQKGSVFQAGEDTFYGRYDADATFGTPFARNGREPLPTAWRAPVSGETQLTVWRESGTTLEPQDYPCASSPVDFPLPLDNQSGGGAIQHFSRSDNFSTPYSGPNPFPLKTQRVLVGSAAFPLAAGDGTLHLNLQHDKSPFLIGQSWVIAETRVAGRWRIAADAHAVDSGCDETLILDPGGPRATNPGGK